jgi:type I restriction enzyme S subunit
VSRIDELIAEHCPAGVPLRALGAVGTFVRGNGLQKKDLVDDGVGAIHYGQVFTTYGTSTRSTKSFVDPALASRLRRARPGDLVIATTSENDADVCKAVAWLGEDEIAISGDAYVFSHQLDPEYVAYFFQTDDFHTQKRRFISGTKVRRVSGTDLARVRIPVPPLAVQREIARILSKMELLKSELESELEYRTRQYAHYRDSLVEGDFDRKRWVTLGDLYESSSGLSKSADQFGFGQPFLAYKTVFGNPTVPSELPNLVNTTEMEQARYSIKAGDVFVTRTSEDVESLGMSSAALADFPKATFNGFTKRLRPKEPDVIDAKFAAYFFRSSLFRTQIARTAVLSTRVSLNDDILLRIRIPLPSWGEQRRVVAILDKFHTLVNDLSAGLPAEIDARRKQYEHYRDRLLTFEEAPA